MSDLLNAFSAAGLWLEKVLEPHLSEDAAREYPHKQEWMNTSRTRGNARRSEFCRRLRLAGHDATTWTCL